jgi:hypothetical protein
VNVYAEADATASEFLTASRHASCSLARTSRIDTDRREERESAVERLRAENAALHAELERMRAQYEVLLDPPARGEKSEAAKEPELFALVGPGSRRSEEDRSPDRLWDSAGPTLCRILERRNPESRWRYYRDERLVPEGVTYFNALEALRKLWGERPGNSDPAGPDGVPTANSGRA